MRKIIAKVSATLATIGAILIVFSSFFPEVDYILFCIGVVSVIYNGIAYIATGEKIREWFWMILDLF